MANHVAYSVVGSVMPAHGGATTPRHRSSAGEGLYSAKQLVDALKAAVAAVKEQLGVLAILDGTATSWPGVQRVRALLSCADPACELPPLTPAHSTLMPELLCGCSHVLLDSAVTPWPCAQSREAFCCMPLPGTSVVGFP